MDRAAALSWLIRVQELETLLDSRQQELQYQKQRRATAEAEAAVQQQNQRELQLQLLDLKQQHAKLEHDVERCRDALEPPSADTGMGPSSMARLRQERDALLRQLQKLKLESEEEEAKCDSFSSVMTEHFDGEQAGVRAAQQRLVKIKKCLDSNKLSKTLAAARQQLAEAQADVAAKLAAHTALLHELESAQGDERAVQAQVAARRSAENHAAQRLQAALHEGRQEMDTAARQQAESEKRLFEIKRQNSTLQAHSADLDAKILSRKEMFQRQLS